MFSAKCFNYCRMDSFIIILQLEHHVSFYDLLITSAGRFHRSDVTALIRAEPCTHTHCQKSHRLVLVFRVLGIENS